MQGGGLLTGLSVTIRHFFGRKETVQYPEEKLPMNDLFRGGRLVLNEEKCIGCKLCAMACPNEALALTVEIDAQKKRRMKSYIHRSGRCLYCNLCVEACPTKAVTWDKNYEIACYHRGDLTYDAVENNREAKNNG